MIARVIQLYPVQVEARGRLTALQFAEGPGVLIDVDALRSALEWFAFEISLGTPRVHGRSRDGALTFTADDRALCFSVLGQERAALSWPQVERLDALLLRRSQQLTQKKDTP